MSAEMLFVSFVSCGIVSLIAFAKRDYVEMNILLFLTFFSGFGLVYRIIG